MKLSLEKRPELAIQRYPFSGDVRVNVILPTDQNRPLTCSSLSCVAMKKMTPPEPTFWNAGSLRLSVSTAPQYHIVVSDIF